MRISPAARARFETKFHQGRHDQCWPWSGSVSRKSRYMVYGVFHYAGQNHPAHRIAYKLYVGSPGRMLVHHTCENPLCVNPAHLALKTRRKHALLHNPRDRKTHCPIGHKFTSENTFRRADGKRECRICRNERARQYRLHQKENAATVRP